MCRERQPNPSLPNHNSEKLQIISGVLINTFWSRGEGIFHLIVHKIFDINHLFF